MTDSQCDVLNDLHLNDGHESISVDESARNEIKSHYESIFSWDIYNRAGKSGDLLSNIIEKITGKFDINQENINHFSLFRFYYKLIISFEYYNSANYKKALSEIEGVIKSLDTCTFDDSYKQYTNSFYHIARSTYAYISLSMNVDPKKIFENIVPTSEFSPDEKAAICAIKAYVFMEYRPKGNEIALEYANQARELCPAKPEWIKVWLIAKGLVRRYFHDNLSRPDENEIIAADTLLRVKNQNSEFLLQASSIYMEIAQYYRYKSSNKNINNYSAAKSIKYFRRAAEIMKEAVMLGKNDVTVLYFCFGSYIYLPEKYRSQQLIDEMIEKLQNVNYYYVDLVLGKYYFKSKDYEKAKVYFSRGKISGTFSCTIQLLQVECYLQDVNKFSYVQTLNEIYETFVSPKRRLIVLCQILFYYCHFEDPIKVMHYLKLYMDQDISDELKKLQLITNRPFFNHPRKFERGFNLLVNLTTYVERISKHNCLNTEENQINIDTLNRFNAMIKVVMTKDERCADDNKKRMRENNEQ